MWQYALWPFAKLFGMQKLQKRWSFLLVFFLYKKKIKHRKKPEAGGRVRWAHVKENLCIEYLAQKEKKIKIEIVPDRKQREEERLFIVLNIFKEFLKTPSKNISHHAEENEAECQERGSVRNEHKVSFLFLLTNAGISRKDCLQECAFLLFGLLQGITNSIQRWRNRCTHANEARSRTFCTSLSCLHAKQKGRYMVI